MTRPVNLYLLSRIPGKDAFNSVYQHVSEKLSAGKTPIHEIESLRRFADSMIRAGVPVDALDGYFFGYKIPQIGKEFDLLKFGPSGCLSIELKSQPVPLAQIRAQLILNRHYLSHLGMEMNLFTFVSDTGECYRMEGDALAPVEFSVLANAVLSFAGISSAQADGGAATASITEARSSGNAEFAAEVRDTAGITVPGATGEYLAEIDGLFKPSEYIVSPAGTPEKFLAREYFLTQAQDQIQKQLVAALSDTTGLAYISLVGKPGTGKTLLLYDVGRTMGTQARTAILHWGDLAEGHETINAASIGLTILPWDVLGEPATKKAATDAEDATAAGAATAAAAAGSADAALAGVLPTLAAYSYVLVDESHRLSPNQFQRICHTAEACHQRVVFCLDPEQILTTAERCNDIAGKVSALPLTAAFTLSERLRGNRELQSFIQEVRDLNCRPKTHLAYRDVDLCYAGTIEEARNQIAYYRQRGYVFINYYRAAAKPTPVKSAAAKPTPAPGAESAATAIRAASNPFAQFEGGYDIHHVIGQEFDRVVLLLDNSFYYTDDDKLEGIPSPDPDILYPNLFYQSITRVQEKLALIVLENEPLFDRISGILEQ